MAATLYILVWMFALFQIKAYKNCNDRTLTDLEECETNCKVHPRCGGDHGRNRKLGPSICQGQFASFSRQKMKKICGSKRGMTREEERLIRAGQIPSCVGLPEPAVPGGKAICFFESPSTGRPTKCPRGRSPIRAGKSRKKGLQAATGDWKLSAEGGEIVIRRFCILSDEDAYRSALMPLTAMLSNPTQVAAFDADVVKDLNQDFAYFVAEGEVENQAVVLQSIVNEDIRKGNWRLLHDTVGTNMVNEASMLPHAAFEERDPQEYIPAIVMRESTPLIRTMSTEEVDSALKGKHPVRFAIAQEGNHAYVTLQHAMVDKRVARHVQTLKGGEMPKVPVISSLTTGTGTGERPREEVTHESAMKQPKFVISSPIVATGTRPGETPGHGGGEVAHEEYDNDYYSQSNHMDPKKNKLLPIAHSEHSDAGYVYGGAYDVGNDGSNNTLLWCVVVMAVLMVLCGCGALCIGIVLCGYALYLRNQDEGKRNRMMANDIQMSQ
eukprot:705514_1